VDRAEWILFVYGLPVFEDFAMPIAFDKEFGCLPKEIQFISTWTWLSYI
jgi:hypothetical protein